MPVAIGGHGQQPGIAEHWELWSHVRGGATPIEALRHGTADGARIYGFTDLGTLEPGKLADLVILDADPTQDIRNTDNIDQVMLNGRLYDAATLNETVTGNRQRQPYYWEADGGGGAAAAADGVATRARATATTRIDAHNSVTSFGASSASLCDGGCDGHARAHGRWCPDTRTRTSSSARSRATKGWSSAAR